MGFGGMGGMGPPGRGRNFSDDFYGYGPPGGGMRGGYGGGMMGGPGGRGGGPGGMFCLHMRGLPFRVTEQVRLSSLHHGVNLLLSSRRSPSGSARPPTRWT